MSDYIPAERALRERFPGFPGRIDSPNQDGHTAAQWVSIYLMDEVYRNEKGDDIEAARAGFTKHFGEALADKKSWAIEAQQVAGGVPWDEDAYRAALHSARTFHTKGATA